MIDLPNNKNIILFDGICNMCNAVVLTLIKFDKKGIFLFCPLQSEFGEKISKKIQINSLKMDSIILFTSNTSYYKKSTAALKIMNLLGGFWKITTIFIIFPETFRNYIYDFIAKNRYKWFGKREVCMLPSDQIKDRFLS